MDSEFRDLLIRSGVHLDLIDYLEDEAILSESRLEAYISRRDEVQDLLVDKVPATAGSRKQATLLIEIWRDAQVLCVERVKRKAIGETSEDLEVPLPEDVAARLQANFERAYDFSLNEHEVLWSHMLGRIRREIEKKTHSLIKVERCGCEREGGRNSAAKRLRWGSSDVTLSFSAEQPCKERDVESNFVYVSLLRILLEGGYAVAGCTFAPGSQKRFAHLQGCRDYVSYVAIRATPISGKWPPIERVRRADEDTRALWASHMRKGATLTEAMDLSKQNMEAFWLWAAQDQIEIARSVLPNMEENARQLQDDSQRLGNFPLQQHQQRQQQRPDQRSVTQQPWRNAESSRGGGKGRGADSSRGGGRGQIDWQKTTKHGKPICEMWNRGQCSQGRCTSTPPGVHCCNHPSEDKRGACGNNMHMGKDHARHQATSNPGR